MSPEHWVETILVTLGILGGAAVWAFGMEARLRVLENAFKDHVEAKKEAFTELKGDMHEIKQTLEQLTRRCIAFRHYEIRHGATLAGEFSEPDDGGAS